MPTKLILQFEKTEPVRFISQLDMLRAIHRALRRAEIPIAYSEGYNPQPRISFAFALSVGLVSYGEYLEALLKAPLSAEQFIADINAVLPLGLKFTNGCCLPEEMSFSVGRAVNCAAFTAWLSPEGCTDQALLAHIQQFLCQEQIFVEKRNKKGTAIIDAKPGIYACVPRLWEDGGIELQFTLALSEQFTLRPDDFLQALCRGHAQIKRYIKNNTLIKSEQEYLSPVEYIKNEIDRTKHHG